MEEHHGVSFKQYRPDWLKNPFSPYPMELDLYNADIGVAYMLHGTNHREFIPSYHGYEEEFTKTLTRDAAKVKLCTENNVKYVVIPHPCTEEEMKALLLPL